MPRRCSYSLVFALLMLGCSNDTPATAEPELGAEALAKIQPGPREVVTFDLGDLGTIRAELYPEIAPKSVAQFKHLVADGFYDGTYFHRVIPGFMIQGGDPNTKNADPRDDGNASSGIKVEDEFSDYPHQRGTLSLANNGYRNSSSSQFFIVHQDNFELDGKYSAFGRVIEGMETVDAVTQLEIDRFGRYGPPNRPYPENATIVSARIETTATTAPPSAR